MGPTVEELNKVLTIKKQIKQSIINKGVEITDTTPFADYPSKIDSIEVGGGDPCPPMHSIYETGFLCKTSYNTNYYNLFNGYIGTELDVSILDTSQATNMRSMFANCQSLATLDVSNFNTSNATNMAEMFKDSINLIIIEGLSNFNTSKVTDMNNMFYNCKKLTSLDLSNFDTSNVTNMGYMFQYCYALTELDLSNFDTSNVTSMGSMFWACTELSTIGDMSRWDTSKVTSMSYMFYSCSKLTSLDVSNFNTSKVTSMSTMFSGCDLLTSLDLSNFNTSKVTNMSSMFAGCDLLTTLNLSSFDMTKVTNVNSMFDGCKSLANLQAPKNILKSISFGYYLGACPLTYESLMSIINNLATVTTTQTLTLANNTIALLSEEDIAIATNKGWTIKASGYNANYNN